MTIQLLFVSLLLSFSLVCCCLVVVVCLCFGCCCLVVCFVCVRMMLFLSFSFFLSFFWSLVFLDRHFTLGQINFWMLFIYLSLCFGCFLWILPNPIHFSAWTAEWLLLLVVQRYRSQQMLLQSNHDLPLMRTSAVPLSPLHPFRPTPRTTATFVTKTTTTPLSMPACGKSESRCAKWIC